MEMQSQWLRVKVKEESFLRKRKEKHNYNLFHRNDSSHSPANRRILMSGVHGSCRRSPRSRLCVGKWTKKRRIKFSLDVLGVQKFLIKDRIVRNLHEGSSRKVLANVRPFKTHPDCIASRRSRRCSRSCRCTPRAFGCIGRCRTWRMESSSFSFQKGKIQASALQ